MTKEPIKTTKQAVGTKILVHIDKAAQKAKSKLKSGLIVPPAYEYMRYNLQYGTILSIGEAVDIPGVMVGRTAIFHHKIESDNPFLVEKLDNGDEIRWLNTTTTSYSYQLYGVIDEDGNIIPVEPFFFCKPQVVEKAELVEIEDGGTGFGKQIFAAKKVGSLYIAEIAKKAEETAHFENEIMLIPPGEKYLKVGQIILNEAYAIYPLELFGTQFMLVQRDFISAIRHDV